MARRTKPTIRVDKIRGGDLRLMNRKQWQKFHTDVAALAERLLRKVRKEIARHGPHVYTRFWRLACKEVLIIKSALHWRDDTIDRYQELAENQARALATRKNPERWKERNAEIMRLHYQGLTPGRIVLKIRTRWPKLENGKPLNADAVKSVIKHRLRRRRRRNGTIHSVPKRDN
jgi:hypothetical protein